MAAKRKTGTRKAASKMKGPRAKATKPRPAKTKRTAGSTRARASRPVKAVEQVADQERQPPPQFKPPPPPVTKKHPAFTAADLFRPGQHVGEHSAADDRIPQQNLLRGELIKKWARGRTEPRRYKQPSQRRRSHDRGG